MNKEFVELGPICREQLGIQCQYGVRYTKDLCADLRYQGTPAEYHSMKIHKDDVDTFVTRVLRHRGEIS
jgi:hypothetical protein